MKTLLTCGLACLLSAGAYAQYAGGNGDGHDAVLGTLTLSAAALNPLYAGGDGDGHDAVVGTLTLSADALNPLYAGGNGDGHDAIVGILTLTADALNPLYAGGDGDGHDARVGILELTSGALIPLFGGGDGDGHDVSAGFGTLLAPLPATLLTFTATLTPAGTVRVDWTVADERDVDHYAVERSGADAAAFAEIGRRAATAATATTDAKAYDLTDAAPLAGPSYYRLRTVDADGSDALSDIVVVLVPDGAGGAGAWTFAAFPSPLAAGEALRLATAGLAAGEPLALRVYDAAGRLVHAQALASAGAAEALEVPGLRLAAGTYRLQLTHPRLGERTAALAVVY